MLPFGLLPFIDTLLDISTSLFHPRSAFSVCFNLCPTCKTIRWRSWQRLLFISTGVWPNIEHWHLGRRLHFVWKNFGIFRHSLWKTSGFLGIYIKLWRRSQQLLCLFLALFRRVLFLFFAIKIYVLNPSFVCFGEKFQNIFGLNSKSVLFFFFFLLIYCFLLFLFRSRSIILLLSLCFRYRQRSFLLFPFFLFLLLPTLPSYRAYWLLLRHCDLGVFVKVHDCLCMAALITRRWWVDRLAIWLM